jgi:phenylacetate-coenzyme A ligase PaaK-like adenylate-forming protein
MSGQGGLTARLVRKVVQISSQRMVDKIIRWIEKHLDSQVKITLVGAPFLVMAVIKRLESQGRRLDLSEKAGIITGGGWKVYENQRITSAEFREAAQRVLGVLPKHCLDVYGMVEGNAWNIHCPEGHYFHIPYTCFKPLVLDKDNRPLPYGEWGRFAFLDAQATSYPGFMTTGDVVRMQERCPVCDRPGPVLDPEIRRASGEDLRGCAEEVRRTMAMDMT